MIAHTDKSTPFQHRLTIDNEQGPRNPDTQMTAQPTQTTE